MAACLHPQRAQRAQSVPSPASACCFAPPPRELVLGGLRSIAALHPKTHQDQGLFGCRDSHPEVGNTHAGAALAAGGTRHAAVPLLPLAAAGCSEGCLQLGAVPAEALREGGESGGVLRGSWSPEHGPTAGRCPIPTLSPSAPRCFSRP